jgi:superfamily II DNA or RNA helicase
MDARLLVLLAMKPRSNKRQLARALMDHDITADPSAVNGRLYALERQGRVTKIDGTPPLWSLAQGQVAAASLDAASPDRARVTGASFPASLEVPHTRTLRQWQEEALAAWISHDHLGVVQAVTGTGKTQVGIEAINLQLARKGKSLVLVPTRALVTQWHKQLRTTFGACVGQRGDGYKDTFRTRDVIVSTVQSAMDGLDLQGREGLLVADECHRYGADQWSRALDPQYQRRLGLSATYERGDEGDGDYLAPYFGSIPIYDIDFRRAIRDEVVVPFRLAFVGVRLSFQDQATYNTQSEIMKKKFGILVNTCGAPKETPAAFMKFVAMAAQGKLDDEATWPARAYASAMTKRRAILADNERKRSLLRDIAPAMNPRAGTLIFTQTKAAAQDSANAVAEATGAKTAAIYGDLDAKERESILEAFRERQTTVLSAPRVLDEGIDVPDADLGVVLAASNGRRQMIQRMGRVLRQAPGKPFARLVVFFAEGTQEDPAVGAHEGFIDLAWDVAERKQIFRGAHQPNEVIQFLTQ